MISQPVFSIFPCSPLPSGTCRTPGLSIPCCCLPTSSSVCLVFFPLSLCLAKCFWPDLMNVRHDHTTAVCVSLRWSGGLRVVMGSGSGKHWLNECDDAVMCCSTDGILCHIRGLTTTQCLLPPPLHSFIMFCFVFKLPAATDTVPFQLLLTLIKMFLFFL